MERMGVRQAIAVIQAVDRSVGRSVERQVGFDNARNKEQGSNAPAV